jgi:hypothetical protein
MTTWIVKQERREEAPELRRHADKGRDNGGGESSGGQNSRSRDGTDNIHTRATEGRRGLKGIKGEPKNV